MSASPTRYSEVEEMELGLSKLTLNNSNRESNQEDSELSSPPVIVLGDSSEDVSYDSSSSSHTQQDDSELSSPPVIVLGDSSEDVSYDSTSSSHTQQDDSELSSPPVIVLGDSSDEVSNDSTSSSHPKQDDSDDSSLPDLIVLSDTSDEDCARPGEAEVEGECVPNLSVGKTNNGGPIRTKSQRRFQFRPSTQREMMLYIIRMKSLAQQCNFPTTPEFWTLYSDLKKEMSEEEGKGTLFPTQNSCKNHFVTIFRGIVHEIDVTPECKKLYEALMKGGGEMKRAMEEGEQILKRLENNGKFWFLNSLTVNI